MSQFSPFRTAIGKSGISGVTANAHLVDDAPLLALQLRKVDGPGVHRPVQHGIDDRVQLSDEDEIDVAVGIDARVPKQLPLENVAADRVRMKRADLLSLAFKSRRSCGGEINHSLSHRTGPISRSPPAASQPTAGALATYFSSSRLVRSFSSMPG